MPKKATTRQNKPKGLSDAELIAKYEAGKQPIGKMVKTLLNTLNPKAPAKVDKSHLEAKVDAANSRKRH